MGALRPGDRGDPGEVGTPTEFTGSMAEAIENELNRLLVLEGKPALVLDNSSDSRDRRMLFIAISRGVIRYLQQNQDALNIVGTSGLSVDIQTDPEPVPNP